MKWKKGWLFLILALLVTGCSNGDKEAKKTITVGVRADIVNFSNYNENTKKYYGLEIDISSEIAKRLGYTDVEYVAVKAEERDDKLETQQVDCVIACYSVTEERKEKFDFSSPYYSDCTSALVQNSSMFAGIEDLRDASVGVLKGTNVAEAVEQWFFTKGEKAEVNFVEYESYAEMEYALEIGDVDAICSDGCIMQQYVTEYRTLYSFEGLNQDYCVATKKGNSLGDSVNKVIEEMKEDGTINELIEKWN